MITRLRQLARAKRRAAFDAFLEQNGLRGAQPARIIDIGGSASFWRRWWNMSGMDKLHVTLINNHHLDVSHSAEADYSPFIENVLMDANALEVARLAEFDLVFSNSFFEHLGSWKEQTALARKIDACGRPYFLQTPNKYSPIDPHHPLAPFFATLPEELRTKLIRLSSFKPDWTLGVADRAMNEEEARVWQSYYRPLGRRDLKRLFPEARVDVERLLFMPMSLIVTRSSRR